MTEVLLKELSSPDIDWIRTAGQDLEVEAGTILRAVNQPLETLYIVLEGTLTVSLSAVEHHPSTQTPTQEIARLTSGEMVGAIPLLEAFLPATTVRAVTPARVLAIPRSQLTQKVQDDLGFAAHLYRASALLLAQQLEQLLRLGDSTLRLGQLQRREAVTVFGELQDSDLDWFIAAGQVQQIAADTVLNHRSRSIDALHILLDGALSLSALTMVHPNWNLLACRGGIWWAKCCLWKAPCLRLP
jgi:CRP-like cAMP-binding protein